MVFDTSSQGLGQSKVPAIVASSGAIAAGTVPAILVATHAIAASSVAVPIIGAAIAGVTLAVGMFLNRNSAYFARASATTHIVDEAETLLKNNLAAWNQSDKYQSEQRQALENFNSIWNQVVQSCSAPQFEEQGRNCVSERSRGGKWDWFSYYYDPIANDPNVKPDPITTTSGVVETVSNIGDKISSTVSDISSSSFLIPGLLLLGGVWALSNIGRGD